MYSLLYFCNDFQSEEQMEIIYGEDFFFSSVDLDEHKSCVLVAKGGKPGNVAPNSSYREHDKWVDFGLRDWK
jgi:hypothetical protein